MLHVILQSGIAELCRKANESAVDPDMCIAEALRRCLAEHVF